MNLDSIKAVHYCLKTTIVSWRRTGYHFFSLANVSLLPGLRLSLHQMNIHGTSGFIKLEDIIYFSEQHSDSQTISTCIVAHVKLSYVNTRGLIRVLLMSQRRKSVGLRQQQTHFVFSSWVKHDCQGTGAGIYLSCG
jgi:hypothetical protein